jgi:hypothetical protein
MIMSLLVGVFLGLGVVLALRRPIEKIMQKMMRRGK